MVNMSILFLIFSPSCLFVCNFSALLTQVEEFHRRDGFEVGNADKIFESTSKDQLSRKAA